MIREINRISDEKKNITALIHVVPLWEICDIFQLSLVCSFFLFVNISVSIEIFIHILMVKKKKKKKVFLLRTALICEVVYISK